MKKTELRKEINDVVVSFVNELSDIIHKYEGDKSNKPVISEKKPRGRPKGSKNVPKSMGDDGKLGAPSPHGKGRKEVFLPVVPVSGEKPKRGRGRPRKVPVLKKNGI